MRSDFPRRLLSFASFFCRLAAEGSGHRHGRRKRKQRQETRGCRGSVGETAKADSGPGSALPSPIDREKEGRSGTGHSRSLDRAGKEANARAEKAGGASKAFITDILG